VLSVRQNRKILIFPCKLVSAENLVISRVKDTWTTVMQEEQIHCNVGGALFSLQANNWEWKEPTAPLTDSLLDYQLLNENNKYLY